MNCVSFYRSEGCYNLCNTKEKSAQYIFDWGKWSDEATKLGLKKSFLIDFDEDRNYDFPTYNALELANELDSIICGHWIDTNRKSIKEVVNFLESIREENEVEMCEDMVTDYINKLEDWNGRLETAQYNLSQKIYLEKTSK